ncbi:hypothetical protein [uncultured Aquimarina sp.]|uniref:hypothetical protein n=1 Tax=uncultured Aquimarina sp. TaxID=575652 RepID=UPI0026190CB8|nr:hypothetical protein [uncultured Aquimarina sp.]
MKTKLLYLTSCMLVLFTACSVDEHQNELEIEENKTKVVELFKKFSKDVVGSPEYTKIINQIDVKNSEELTAEERERLEQELLSQQSPEFVILYKYVVDLELSREELRTIVFEYYSISKRNALEVKNDGDGCAVTSALGDMFIWLAELVCEVKSEQVDG